MTHRHHQNILLVVLGLAAACAYAPAEPPTAPSAAAPSRAPVAFTIQALPLVNRAGAAVNLKAWADNGAWALLDATCSSTHGGFEQPRVRSSAPTSITLTGSATMTRVTCRTDNGLSAEADVDLSAWELQVLWFDEQLNEQFRSRTFLHLRANALQPGLPLTTRTIDWGDGTVEPWLTQTAFPADLTFVHVYPRTGTFTITASIAWAGGQRALPVLIQRTCQQLVPWSDGLCQTTWRLP